MRVALDDGVLTMSAVLLVNECTNLIQLRPILFSSFAMEMWITWHVVRAEDDVTEFSMILDVYGGMLGTNDETILMILSSLNCSLKCETKLTTYLHSPS